MARFGLAQYYRWVQVKDPYTRTYSPGDRKLNLHLQIPSGSFVWTGDANSLSFTANSLESYLYMQKSPNGYCNYMYVNRRTGEVHHNTTGDLFELQMIYSHQ